MKQTLRSNLVVVTAIFCIQSILVYSQPVVWTVTHSTYINAGDQWDYLPPISDAVSSADGSIFAIIDNQIVKYKENGTQLFSTPVFLGIPANIATPNEIVTDETGNVYVVGDIYSGVSSLRDMVIVKYSQDLDYQWHTYVTSNIGSNEYGRHIRYENVGEFIYVAGQVSNTGSGNPGILVAKYSLSGVKSWTAFYGEDISNNDFVNDLEVDAAGNAYICGYTDDPILDARFLVAKFNTFGKPVYAKLYDASPFSIYDMDIAYDLAVDDEERVYAVGVASKPASGQDQVLIKYKSDGSTAWKKFYTSKTVLSDYGYFVQIDGEGGIVTCGKSAESDNPGNTKMTLRKYTAGGELLWSKFYKSPFSVSSSSDFNGRVVTPGEMKVNNSGAIYVTGHVQVMDDCEFLNCWINDYHSFTVSYNTDGSLEWEDIIEEADGVQLLSNEDEGTLYSIGYQNVFDYNYIDLFIRKYAPVLKNSEEVITPVSTVSDKGNMQLDVFPNPATSGFIIQSSCLLPEISIFNMNGQQVYFQCGAVSPESRINVSDWANGIYLIRVKDDAGVGLTKLVVSH